MLCFYSEHHRAYTSRSRQRIQGEKIKLSMLVLFSKFLRRNLVSLWAHKEQLLQHMYIYIFFLLLLLLFY